MPKVQPHQFDEQEKRAMLGAFYDSIENTASRDDAVDFIVGLLTPSEVLMLSRRIQIARLLLEGKSYREIASELSVGTETIAGVYRWIYSGDEKKQGSLQRFLSGTPGKKQKRKKEGWKRQDYFSAQLDRYPQHRFLMELLGLRD